MKMTDNEIKLAKASALKDVLIFILEFQKDNSEKDLSAEIVKYLEETIESYE
jgi:hypothetical protein